MSGTAPTRAEMRRMFREADKATKAARERENALKEACSRWMNANRRWGLRPEAIRHEVGA